jgi:halocyanin-like protein
MQRRTYLAVLGGSLAGLAGCRGGSQEYGDWFENVDNDDGEADRTDESTVTVAVGADDGFAFEPAAIRVTTGTTVVWEWTGEGVAITSSSAPARSRASTTATKAPPSEYTLEDPGLFPYSCEPHREMGMKGSGRVE